MTHHVIEMFPQAPGFGPALPGPVRQGDSVWFLNKDRLPRQAVSDPGLPCAIETGIIPPHKAFGIKIYCPPGLIPFHDPRLPHLREVLEIRP